MAASYCAPLRDMHFVLHELLDVGTELKALPRYAEVDADTINSILEEGARFATDVLLPLNQSGDAEGCVYVGDGVVQAPKGFREAYQRYVEAGWPSLPCDPEFGGQGLPKIVNNAFLEMLNSANQAWTMYPGLSHGAYEALRVHGTPEQQKLYLPKLVSGEWTGTMCLTEPHCGSDLGILRSKAEAAGDGSYLISGTKIFISAGEHDLSQNIVHLVLARLPGAPTGTKGISLFIVHPDVRRMLLTQKAYTEAARAFTYWVALQIDREHEHPTDAVRKDAEDLVALLTPVVKAFITDNGFECTNLGLQAFGGHGYIREWGMEQFVRDARINLIYEGTNTIQSIDLLARKDEDFYKSKLATARFYYAKLLPETAGLIRQARAGAAPLMQLDAALF